MIPFQSPLHAQQQQQLLHVLQQQQQQQQQRQASNSAASPSLLPSLPSAAALLSSPTASSLPSSLSRPPSSSSALGVSSSPLQLSWGLQSSTGGSGLSTHFTHLHLGQQQQANINSLNALIQSPPPPPPQQQQLLLSATSQSPLGTPQTDLNLLHPQQQLYQQYLQHKHQTQQQQQQQQQSPLISTSHFSPQLTTSTPEQHLVSTLLARHAAQQQQWQALQQLQPQQPLLLPATPSSPTAISTSLNLSKPPSSPAILHVQPMRVSQTQLQSGDVEVAVLMARVQAAEQQRDQAMAVVQQAASILTRHGVSTTAAAAAATTSTSSISPSSSHSSPSSSPSSAFQPPFSVPLSSVSSAPLVEVSQLLSTFLASQPTAAASSSTSSSSSSSSPSAASSSLLVSPLLPITPVGSSIGNRRRTASSAFHAPSTANKADRDGKRTADEQADDSSQQQDGRADGRPKQRSAKKEKRRSSQRASKRKRRRKSSNASVSSSSSSTTSESSTDSSSTSLSPSSSSSSSSSSPSPRSSSVVPAAASTSASLDGHAGHSQAARMPAVGSSPTASSVALSSSPASSSSDTHSSRHQAVIEQLDGMGGDTIDDDSSADEDETTTSHTHTAPPLSSSSPTAAPLPSQNVLTRLSSHRKKRDRSCLPCPTLHHINKTPLRTIDVYIEQEYTLSKRESSLLSTAETQRLVRVGVRFLSNGVGERELYVVAKDMCVLLHTRKGNVAKSIGQFSGEEKCRMAVICPRSDGTVSTHVLTVLSVGGVKRLLDGSRSGVVDSIRQWFFHQLVDMGHPQAQLFAPRRLPAADEQPNDAPPASSGDVEGAASAAASSIVGLGVDSPWASSSAPSAFLPHPATVGVPVSVTSMSLSASASLPVAVSSSAVMSSATSSVMLPIAASRSAQ